MKSLAYAIIVVMSMAILFTIYGIGFKRGFVEAKRRQQFQFDCETEQKVEPF